MGAHISCAITTMVILFHWLLFHAAAIGFPHIGINLILSAGRFLHSGKFLVTINDGVTEEVEPSLSVTSRTQTCGNRLDTITDRLLCRGGEQAQVAFKRRAILRVMVADNLSGERISPFSRTRLVFLMRIW